MFSLFKKKMNIIDYCHQKYDFIFSSEGLKLMDDLIKQCDISLDEDGKNFYRNNFIAAYFELINIALAKTTPRISRSLRMEVMIYRDKYLKEKSLAYISDLISLYSGAFGSSIQDGIMPMADTIAVITENSDIFYKAFINILKELFAEIKGIVFFK